MDEYNNPTAPASEPEQTLGGMDSETKTWSMILHLSLLSGLIVPMAGLVVPIVIYLVKKESLPGLEPHGHVVFNWLISALIYAIVSIILMFVLIGFLLIAVLAILAIVFPIIGAVKASDGEVWAYPLSIKFFK